MKDQYVLSALIDECPRMHLTCPQHFLQQIIAAALDPYSGTRHMGLVIYGKPQDGALVELDHIE